MTFLSTIRLTLNPGMTDFNSNKLKKMVDFQMFLGKILNTHI